MKLATPQQLALLVLHNRKSRSELSESEKATYSYLLRKHSPTPVNSRKQRRTPPIVQEEKQISRELETYLSSPFDVVV